MLIYISNILICWFGHMGMQADACIELLSMWQLQMQIDLGVLNWQLKNYGWHYCGGHNFVERRDLGKVSNKIMNSFLFFWALVQSISLKRQWLIIVDAMAPHQDPLQDWSTYLSSCWECW